MEKILISACLLGDKTKYDGGDNYYPFVEELKKKYILIPFCPEIEGGLGVPRAPSEIQRDGSVLTKDGRDVTSSFVSGAEKAYQATRFFGISIAILKNGSPSCGSRQVYDGSFKGNLVDGLGITARRLIAAGVKVYSDTDNLAFLLGESEEQKEERKKRNIEKEKAKKEGRPFKDESKPRRMRKEGFSHLRGDEERKKREGKRGFKKQDGERTFAKRTSSEYEKKPFRKGGFKKGYRKDYQKGGYPEGKKEGGYEKTFHKDGSKKPYGEKKAFGKGPKKEGYRKSHYASKGGFKKSFGPKKGGFKKPYSDKKKFEK